MVKAGRKIKGQPGAQASRVHARSGEDDEYVNAKGLVTAICQVLFLVTTICQIQLVDNIQLAEFAVVMNVVATNIRGYVGNGLNLLAGGREVYNLVRDSRSMNEFDTVSENLSSSVSLLKLALDNVSDNCGFKSGVLTRPLLPQTPLPPTPIPIPMLSPITKFEKRVRYASRKARADVRKRVKGRFVKAGDAYDYDPLSHTRSI
ncbi:hypothetical protein Cgig2_007481 [Carnegiea gigantea]|uniref:CCT domain-containing protein n=1 Tax=Carnegiea gigantea TaxID=171969 RepID=A0A9Q1QDA1_9CARY|nr:hypothetical protein Cgig2_007481 [Carnegiea gigantea]